jgi:hypothetical protein
MGRELKAPQSPAKTPTTPVDSGFQASHFFILASLMAATGAVILARRSSPEHLILISVTIATAGLAGAGLYRLLAPLVGASAGSAAEPLSERARAVIEREKALALRGLKELEFDRSMGKISPADFEEMAGRLRARALSLMKQLDDEGSDYRSLIERELQNRLAVRAGTRGKASEPPPAPGVADVCACGTPIDPDALFCKRCGVRIASARPGSDSPDHAR